MAIPKVVEQTPVFVKLAVRWLPEPLSYGVMTQIFRHLFQQDCERGAFDFLLGKTATIHLTDLELMFQVSATQRYQRTTLVVSPAAGEGDVKMRVSWPILLQLATQQVDPDTLFFRRKLLITGDTELGLEIKNLLDTIELKQRLPAVIYQQLCKLAENSMI